jgi:hypothetical protein
MVPEKILVLQSANQNDVTFYLKPNINFLEPGRFNLGHRECGQGPDAEDDVTVAGEPLADVIVSLSRNKACQKEIISLKEN